MQSNVALTSQSTPISTPLPSTNINCYCTCNRRRFLQFDRSKSVALNSFTRKPIPLQVRAGAEGVEMITHKLGIRVERNPSDTRLSELGVKQWSKWGCPPSNFPWTYSAKETCYLLKGKVKVTPEGANEAVEIQAGDLVIFPKGMSCTWDVSETVDKHYLFE
ncbi:hypothetical protein V2J09_010046 [Rumex salicifolius]